MTLIRRPTPLGQLIALRSAMNQLFDDSPTRPQGGWPTVAPRLALDIDSISDSVAPAVEGAPAEQRDVEHTDPEPGA